MIRIAIFSASLCLWIMPALTYADVFWASDASADVPVTAGCGSGQCTSAAFQLGTGIGGTLSTITWYGGNTGHIEDPDNYGYSIHCYNDSGYSSSCGWVVIDSVPFDDATYRLRTFTLDTPAVLDPSKYYVLSISNAASGGENSAIVVYGETSPDICTSYLCVGTPYLTFDDDSYEGQTRVVSVDPYDGETVATSTDLVVTYQVYVADEDAGEDTVLEIRSHRRSDSQVSVADPNSVITTTQEILDTPGMYEVEITVDASRDGVYQLDASIYVPASAQSWLEWVGIGGVLIGDAVFATTTRFIANVPNAFDLWMSSTTDAIATYAETLDYDTCTSWTGLDLQECLRVLFIPSQDAMQTLLGDFRNNVLAVFPFGYVTRATEIFMGDNISELPDISFTMPSMGTSVDGQVFHFEPWNYFYTDGAPVKDLIVSRNESQSDFWTITEPLITLVVYLYVFYLIINDLLAIAGHTERRGMRISTSSDNQAAQPRRYTYR